MTQKRPRRARTAVESLCGIVLIFESVVVFLGSLAVFGLKALPPELALGGGAVVVVLLFVTAGVVRWRWGLVLGSALQVVVILSGILVPAMWFVGGIFALMWAYALYSGLRLEQQKKEQST